MIYWAWIFPILIHPPPNTHTHICFASPTPSHPSLMSHPQSIFPDTLDISGTPIIFSNLPIPYGTCRNCN